MPLSVEALRSYASLVAMISAFAAFRLNLNLPPLLGVEPADPAHDQRAVTCSRLDGME
jgi:hypothetical protein